MTRLLLLAMALLGLAAGPALLSFPLRGESWRRWVDGVAIVLVVLPCVVLLVPDAVGHVGWVALAGVAVGFSLPALLHRFEGFGVRASVLVGLGLLALHAAVDGAAIALVDGAACVVVGIGVAAHRLPVGVAVFKGVGQEAQAGPLGPAVAGWSAVAMLMLATVVGFFGAGALGAIHSEWVVGMLEAVVAGTLLHVVTDRHAEHGGVASAADHDHV